MKAKLPATGMSNKKQMLTPAKRKAEHKKDVKMMDMKQDPKGKDKKKFARE